MQRWLSLLPLLLTFFVTVFQSWTVLAEDFNSGPVFRIGVRSLEELAQDDFDVLKARKTDGHYGNYVAPNEWQPALMLPLLVSAPTGSLVSVGTQRCLMTAAKIKRILKAHCYDMSHGVLMFNLLNAKLIASAKDRRDFLFLALKASSAVWKKRLSNAALGDERIQDLFDFWNYHFRVNPLNRFFTESPTRFKFGEMNYLYDDALFVRLQKMIRAGDITFDWLDVKNTAAIQALVKSMKANGETLSIIDFSNIPEWITFTPIATALNEFVSISRPETVVLQTIEEDVRWTYFAFDLTNENQQKLKTYPAGADAMAYFLMRSSTPNFEGRDYEAFKVELKKLEKDWSLYLGSEN